MDPTAKDDGPLIKTLRRDDAAWAREHLETDVVAWLTTVAQDGRPQSSVVSFLHESDTILVYSEPDTPKLRNIAHSPLVSFHLQSDPYGDHYLVIEGTAAIDLSVPPVRCAPGLPRQVPRTARPLGDGRRAGRPRFLGPAADHAPPRPGRLSQGPAACQPAAIRKR